MNTERLTRTDTLVIGLAVILLVSMLPTLPASVAAWHLYLILVGLWTVFAVSVGVDIIMRSLSTAIPVWMQARRDSRTGQDQRR